MHGEKTSMTNIFKHDIYRFSKSKLLYSILLLTAIIPFSLAMIVRQDIRLGINFIGSMTAFVAFDDIIRTGLIYHSGLGILVAVIISVFIGQEYKYNTWQHKWIISKSRVGIYLSKLIISIAISAVIFLLFQGTILLASNQTSSMLTYEYTLTIISGVFIYAALGSVICTLSILIKNSTVSIVASIGYVLFIGRLAFIILGVVRNLYLPETIFTVTQWFVRHSIFGMSTAIVTLPTTISLTVNIVINALSIMIISMSIGLLAFRKYEL